MNVSRAKTVRWTAWLAWLALAASLLATMPGSAQAQDSTDDPIDTAPTVISAEKNAANPFTSIIVEWVWSYPLDPEVKQPYSYEVQISRDQPGSWYPHVGEGELVVEFRAEEDEQTGVLMSIMKGIFTHQGQRAGDTFHYRVRVNSADGATVGPWVTVGPVSTEPLPQPQAPSGFSAVPSSDEPQSKIVLSWDPVTAATGSKVYYRLDMLDPQTNVWERVDSYAETRYVQGPVVPDQAWEYRLWTVSDYGDPGISVSEAATATVTPNRPPAPTGLAAGTDASSPSTTAVITWNPVPQEAGSQVYYRLRFRRTDSGDDSEYGDGDHDQWRDVPADSWRWGTTYRHGRRPAGSTWEYQAKAIRTGLGYTHQQVSDWSDSATVTLATDIGGL